MSAKASRFRLSLRVLTVLYWAGIFTATHLPPTRLPKTHVPDKIEHITAYFILTAMLYLSIWRSRLKLVWLGTMLMVVVLAYGAIDELTQPYFQRTCDIKDWYADACGSLAAVLVMSLIRVATRRP